MLATNKQLKLYQSKSAIREVLGCLVQNPVLLASYKITKDDFVEAFHKIVFVGINNLFNAGTVYIDSSILEEYLKNEYPTKYAIYAKNNGSMFVDKAKSVAILDNFNSNYNEMKKFSLLRELLKQDIDVSDFFDPNEVDPLIKDKARDLFEKSSVDDIIDFYKNKLFAISQTFSKRSSRDSLKAGSEAAKRQKEIWKDKPQVGLEYCSNYLTTVTYGLRRKKFTVMSAPTGTGKSRITIANICRAFVPRYWDDKKKAFVKNPHGTQNVALYIGTEMQLIEEIEPILWAYIADVPEDHILFGNYLYGEEERVDEAIKILNEEANIYLEYLPDYDVNTLESIIDEHVTTHGVGHVFFDYMHTTTDLISEYQDAAKARMQVREDQVLGNLSTKLKELTEKYNISIDTWTQVSGDFKN